MYRQYRYLLSTNAKDIGIMYGYFGILLGIIGTSYSFLIRVNLYTSNILIQGNIYNNIITNHGLIMIFYMVIPLLIGMLGNILIPILIGSIDMLFSRLNNISFLLLLFGTLLVIISSLSNLGYGPGWTLYANLILLIGHWDINIDLLIFSIHILGISSLLASINFIITIILTKHIGLTWYLLSLYSWSIYITSYLILVSIPILGVAVTMLLLDRNINTNYFIYENQGNVLIYQNVFWFFGHIEVNIYILSYISK